jgi:hypothetical protein
MLTRGSPSRSSPADSHPRAPPLVFSRRGCGRRRPRAPVAASRPGGGCSSSWEIRRRSRYQRRSSGPPSKWVGSPRPPVRRRGSPALAFLCVRPAARCWRPVRNAREKSLRVVAGLAGISKSHLHLQRIERGERAGQPDRDPGPGGAVRAGGVLHPHATVRWLRVLAARWTCAHRPPSWPGVGCSPRVDPCGEGCFLAFAQLRGWWVNVIRATGVAQVAGGTFTCWWWGR